MAFDSETQRTKTIDRVAQRSKCQNGQNNFMHTDNGYNHKRFSSITQYTCQWILLGTFVPQSEFAIWFTKAIFFGLSTIPSSCFASGLYFCYVAAASQICAAKSDTRDCRHWRCNWLSCSCIPVDTTRRSKAYGEEQQSNEGSSKISQFPPNFWSVTLLSAPMFPRLSRSDSVITKPKWDRKRQGCLKVIPQSIQAARLVNV